MQTDGRQLQGFESSEECQSEIENIRTAETEEIRTLKNELQTAVNQLNNFIPVNSPVSRVSCVGTKLNLRTCGALTGKPEGTGGRESDK